MKRRPWQLVTIVVALAVFTAACSADDERVVDRTAPPTSLLGTPTTEAPDTSTSTTSTTSPPLTTSIDWTICGDLECGRVEVPVDYDDPGGETLSIAVNMLRAADTDRRLGVLLVNPGGPGASGLDFAEAFAFGAFPSELTDNFDIVGFDPRGVGGSGPEFECGASGEQLALLADIDELVDEPDEVIAVHAAVELCADSMGQVAGKLGTDFVARDMDEIRKALGEEQVSFLGFSYGSVIGVWYASLFPDRVRAMVIDGANNPVDELDSPEQRLASVRQEIEPISELLEQAINACDDESCPIFNGGDPEGYYYEAVTKLELVNAAMADNPDAGFLALITTLYSEASWPTLWEALADLQERDDPSLFARLGEFQLGDDPGAANFTAHVNCLDSWSLQPAIDREARLQSDAEFLQLEDQLSADYPLLGAIESESTSICPFYDLINPPPLDAVFDGGGVPILVIGNRSDPVTSFGESEELVDDILSNGVLIEVDHPDHTVYPSNECVNAFVHDVLLDVEFPENGAACGREGAVDNEILVEVCVAIAPDQAPDLSAEEIDVVCRSFAEAAYARLGRDVVDEALFSDDEDAGAALLDVLLDELDAVVG
jgi:pimeloyl-ACP methyl ester carboxylesterase